LPLVIPFEIGNAGLSREGDPPESESESTAGLTNVGEFNLGFLSTLIGVGAVRTGNATSTVPRDANPTGAEFVPGQGEGLGADSAPGGGSSGEGLPIESLIPLLFEMVQDWAPSTGRDFRIAAESVAEALLETVSSVKAPVQLTLESLDVGKDGI